MKDFKITAEQDIKVAKLLTTSKRCQTDNGYLIARIWYDDMIAAGINRKAAVAIGKLVAGAKLTSAGSITRSRRRLQELDSNTYGTFTRGKDKSVEIKNQVVSEKELFQQTFSGSICR